MVNMEDRDFYANRFIEMTPALSSFLVQKANIHII